MTAGTALSAEQFHSGAGATAAHDASDRIVYDTASGALYYDCLLYTSDAADERSSVDLGGRRIIKKKTIL